MKDITLFLDPFLARKVQVVAMEHGITFVEALFFLIHRVITPQTPALVKDLVI